MLEIIRQCPGRAEMLHAGFHQDRMMDRDDEGQITLGDLVVTTLTLVSRRPDGKTVIEEDHVEVTKDV